MGKYYEEYKNSTREEKLLVLQRLLGAWDVTMQEKIVIMKEWQKVLGEVK